jgi:chemotaxis protein MotA
MDFTTILGFFLGIGFIVYSISLVGPLTWFISYSSIMIVVGGTICSTMISYPLKTFINAFKAAKHVFFDKKVDIKGNVKLIIDLANLARKEGLLALEEAGDNMDDSFLKKGILLIVDGADPELVKDVLETEILFIEKRHMESQKVFRTLAAFSPAFGMIGTLIGLIAMLQQLENPDTLGPSMGVALITTFYGTLIANLICSPIAEKLKTRTQEEMLLREMMIEGLLSIQAGENPRIISEKLKAFLSPIERDLLDKEETSSEEGVN